MINKERQNLLKIEDLESTIIKFGDQKNFDSDNFCSKEENYKNEIKKLEENLFESKQKVEKSETHYLQSKI